MFLTEKKRDDYRARGEAAGYPTIRIDRVDFEGREGWDRLLASSRDFVTAGIVSFERQLIDAEQGKASQEANRMPERAPADLNAPETAQEQIYREINEDAAREAAYRNSSEGRSDRTIALLERIAAAVEKQAGQ